MNLAPPAPLAAGHDTSQFDCGDPQLNQWLQHRALRNESRFSRSYVVCAGNRVAGFYCLSAGAVERTAAPGTLRRNAPDAIPVAVLGRLAVDRSFAGQGLGTSLLADALHRTAHASRSIGIAALLVHAKSDAARAFYMEHAEFLEFPADSLTLFLPVSAIVAAGPE